MSSQQRCGACGPLDGVRVLDLAGPSGTFAGRVLADLGAEVVRVEPPGGEELRQRPPFLGDDPGSDSLHHLHFNLNKRSVTLDIRDANARDDFLRLAATADILIQTGAMEAVGLDVASLQEANAHLIHTSITPFGSGGPLVEARATDLVAAAMGGLVYLNGFPEDPPNVPGSEQAYHMASLVAAASSLVALVGRERDPLRRGRHIEVSVQEAVAMTTAQTANANIYTWHGEIPRRMGNVGTVVECADGRWVSFMLRVGVQDTWAEFAAWLREAAVETPAIAEAFHDPAYRAEHREDVTAAVAALCARYDREAIVREGQRRRQLVLPINNVADLVHDEHLRQRGFFVGVHYPESGRTLIDAGAPYRFSDTPITRWRRAPLPGEDNDDILAGLPLQRETTSHRQNAQASFDPARPLAGIRVADFSWMIAGPAASRMLADFGADVVKIESEYRLDNIRVVGVKPTGRESIETNGVFNDVNTNKRSLRLNLNHPEGLRLARRLVDQSDVTMNNYMAGRMAKWGLGYDALRDTNPGLVMLSMPVMGSDGPYIDYGAYGNGVVAFSGLNMNMGLEGRPPVGMGPLYSDFSAPYFAVTAIMAALYHRERTGHGQFIDLSQAETAVSLLGTDILEYTANGAVPPRPGNRARDACPHGIYPCTGEDRWCAIAVPDDEAWRGLCRALGRDDLLRDDRLASLAGRKSHENELDAVIAKWTVNHDPWEAMRLLQAHGVPAGVVQDLEDMLTRDPMLPTEHFVELQAAEPGVTFTTHAQPLTIDGLRPPLLRAPALGEHTEPVLHEYAGLSADEVEALVLAGAIY